MNKRVLKKIFARKISGNGVRRTVPLKKTVWQTGLQLCPDAITQPGALIPGGRKTQVQIPSSRLLSRALGSWWRKEEEVRCASGHFREARQLEKNTRWCL